MTRAQVLKLVQEGRHATFLPREIDSKILIVAIRPSKCSNAPSLLVASRHGGFIAQDCLACGTRSEYVHEQEIPDLECTGCRLPRGIEPKVIDKNYWYECTRCRRQWMIAEIVPVWSELFEYSGLSAPGDASISR